MLCRPLPGVDINPLSEQAAIQKIPLKEAPEDLFSLGRTIMLLRGLCHALGLDIKVKVCLVQWTDNQACCRLTADELDWSLSMYQTLAFVSSHTVLVVEDHANLHPIAEILFTSCHIPYGQTMCS